MATFSSTPLGQLCRLHLVPLQRQRPWQLFVSIVKQYEYRPGPMGVARWMPWIEAAGYELRFPWSLPLDLLQESLLQ